MLQASAISMAQMLIFRSETREFCSDAWVKASVKCVRASISSNSSGKSTRGNILATRCRSAISDGVSSTASRGLRINSVLSPFSANLTAGFSGSRFSTSRYVESSSVAIADRVAPGVDDNPRERQIIERRASHSLPSMSPARGSA